MNIVQQKVNGMKTVINIALTFSSKEMTDFALDMGFEPIKGEKMIVRGEELPTYAIFSLDQIQGHNEVAFLGFDKTQEDREEANGIYYRMEMEENGEGKAVNGKITYIPLQIKLSGKLYNVDANFKLPNGETLTTRFEEAYNGKSAKNSTLFHMVRKLIKNGYITPKALAPFYKAVEEEKEVKAKAPKAPKQVRQTSKSKEKQA